MAKNPEETHVVLKFQDADTAIEFTKWLYGGQIELRRAVEWGAGSPELRTIKAAVDQAADNLDMLRPYKQPDKEDE